MHSILGRGSFSTNSSFSPLFVKLSQVFESVLIDSILKLTGQTLTLTLTLTLLLVHLFVPNFFLPVNFAFNIL